MKVRAQLSRQLNNPRDTTDAFEDEIATLKIGSSNPAWQATGRQPISDADAKAHLSRKQGAVSPLRADRERRSKSYSPTNN